MAEVDVPLPSAAGDVSVTIDGFNMQCARHGPCQQPAMMVVADVLVDKSVKPDLKKCTPFCDTALTCEVLSLESHPTCRYACRCTGLYCRKIFVLIHPDMFEAKLPVKLCSVNVELNR